MEESDAPVSFGRVLKNRQFCALWLAQLVSSFGDWLALLALFSYIAFRLQGTPSQSTSMSLMTAAQLGSFLVAGTVANWLGIRNLYYLVGLTLILISMFAYGYKRVIRINEAS
ncbi:MAG TPA: hypothetical protein VGQ39_16170 [Pyrinomonadaceae bacterium]|jgi:Na+/melibiose symporter-like transporter|nr:hypothetical protein [Pyrinomonadaceae bacterium]